MTTKMAAGCGGTTDTLALSDLLNHFNTASDEDLRTIVLHCSNLLQQRESAKKLVSNEFLLNNFKYLPNFLTKPSNSLDISTHLPEQNYDGDQFVSDLRLELESLGLEDNKNSKVKTQWLVSNPVSHPDLKNAKPLDKYEQISKLMSLVNKHEDVVGEVNGCIVNCFRNESARHYPHADDEKYIDQTCSIATLSIGPTRCFNIYEKKHKPVKVLKSFNVESGSLMLMQPGSQSMTKHKIEKQTESSDTVRYSISFRKLIDRDEHTATMGAKNVSPPTPTPEPPTTLIIGTSIPDDLNEHKLAGRHKSAKVIKLCKRGAHVKQISDLVDGFYKSKDCNPSNVDKVIMSIGTNDIRYCRNGVGHLFFPVRNLVQKVKTLFPLARIYIQSLIPIRYHQNNPGNLKIVENVLEFNKLLLKAAAEENCFFFNMFDKFLDPTPARVPIPHYYRDAVHLSSAGLSILARSYIEIIRGRKCSIINV